MKKWPFPSAAFVPGEGFRLVWMDGQAHQTSGTNWHASFALVAATGSVALVYSNAGEIIVVDYINYTVVPEDKSQGSYPDGDQHARLLLQLATPLAPNTPMTLASLIEVLLPRFMQGEQDINQANLNRVPFVYRARIEGLLPGHTYRFANRVVTNGEVWNDDGAGNMIFAKTNGENFVRSTESPRFRPGDLYMRHGAFTTDESGVYEGWFINEPTGNARFTPGYTVRPRILLNDGIGGETIAHSLTTTGTVSVIAFGTGASEASAIVGSSHSAPARDLIALYDDQAGASRPLAVAYVEVSGAAVDDKYADFYVNEVSGQATRWGNLIPNTLPNGVRRIEQRGLADGTLKRLVYSSSQGMSGTVNP
ncbi:MAG: hypothetical protein EOM24_31875, partial [Chloroflexia bacterium]|nr:hypothetical protein [Chloroflexia bacterium]